MENKKQNPIYYLSRGISEFAQKYLPDAYILALIISLVVFSTVCVGTEPVKKIMYNLAGLPRTPVQAIMLGCIMELILFPLNSTFALVFGAIYAKEVGKKAEKVDYPLLVAVCYCGYCTWQGGIAGSTTLQMATENSPGVLILGHTLPLSETIFTLYNGTLLFSLIITIPILVYFMIPKKEEDMITIEPGLFYGEESKKDYVCAENASIAVKLEYSRIPTLAAGIFMVLFIMYRFGQSGIDAMDINMLNMILLCVSLLFVKNARQFLDLMSSSMKEASGIIIQFPIYAGIMGMMVDSGLGAMLSSQIVQFATASSLPNICHLAASFLNIFVPSGGGQWSIEAAIYLPVAQSLGTDPARVVLACGYGDALTNLIQPFWALPLLSITRLSMRDIMGYCTVICLWGLICTQTVMAIFAFL